MNNFLLDLAYTIQINGAVNKLAEKPLPYFFGECQICLGSDSI